MKKSLLLLIVVLLSVSMVTAFSLAGCKKAAPAETTAAAETTTAAETTAAVETTTAGKKFVIGFVPRAFVSPYFITMGDSVNAAAAEAGIEVQTLAPVDQKDIEGQINMIEDLTQKGVDMLAVALNDPKAAVPSLLEAQKKGIPIVVVDTLISLGGIEVLSLVGSSHEDGGTMLGKYLVELLDEKGKIAIIEGVSGQDANEYRLKGMRSVLDQYPDIKIVASQPGNWDRSQAMAVMENYIQAKLNPDVVFCLNDGMAIGAIKALEDAGMTGKIKIVGYNGDAEALTAVKEGKLQATILQQPAEIGKTIVKIAQMIRDGKEKEVEPIISIPIILLTSDNIDQYLK